MMFAGGVLGVVGVIDAESELGRSRHPLLLAALMAAVGGLYGLAGTASLSGRRQARALNVAAFVVMALQVSVRLAVFGVVGVGDLLVLAVVATLVIRDRHPATAFL